MGRRCGAAWRPSGSRPAVAAERAGWMGGDRLAATGDGGPRAEDRRRLDAAEGTDGGPPAERIGGGWKKHGKLAGCTQKAKLPSGLARRTQTSGATANAGKNL